MKKIFYSAIALMLVFTLTACGSSDAEKEYIGTWSTVDMIMDGQSYKEIAESAGLELSDFGGIDFEFKSNGEVTMTDITGSTDPINAKWEVVDGGVEVSDAVDTITFTLADGQLTGEVEGIEIVLEKAE